MPEGLSFLPMRNDKKYYRRPARSRSSKKRHGSVTTYVRSRTPRQTHFEKTKIAPELKLIFNKIGVPETGPFKADSFQQEALELIRDYDVLVSAPTGSGKTWIASQTIHSYLAEDLSVWYASPLKALSNSIYQEFCHEFGPSNCGILTGDRKENPGAPVIVGTTEILRNQLYDAMHKGASIRADLVILDEAHYLSDPERGVVWEEVLIYLPSRVRLLLLSATISNAEEVCRWLREIRGTPNRVVRSEERPVPLEMLFLFNEGLIVPLFGKKGLSPKVKGFMASTGGGQRRRSERLNFGKIIRQLRDFDLLPAIFFLKSRSDCDRAIFTCPPVDMTPKMKESLRVTIGIFLREYPHLKGHRQMGPLLESRVGSHHGGQLPYWKVLVEKMMSRGYLEAIFSTSTVAAGVNFPARTVVLVQSDRYNGHEFIDLTATDFHQMIGRAGRRGKDRIVFGVVIPGIHQDPQLIKNLKDSPAEPLLSQIHINFSMTLNLLLSHTPSEVKDLLDLSFASFQEKEMGPFLKREWNKRISELRKIVPESKCDTADPYEILENIQKRLELQKEVRRLTQSIRYERLLNAYKKYLKPGRLFLHKNGNTYMIFHTY
ncbi:MAG: DEAD/DEAH box helicase, partial [Desulfobacteraceae bacterium]